MRDRDTGYRATTTGPVCPVFQEIGYRYGPFDVACIPVWRGACFSGISKVGLRVRAAGLMHGSGSSCFVALRKTAQA